MTFVADPTSLTLGAILLEIAKENEKQVLDWIENISVILESGVESVGDAAAYALVWEWGNLRQTKQGPKTVLGTNPDGESVWLSTQAPTGWISINEPRIWDAIIEEVGKVKFESISDVTSSSLIQEMTEAYNRIAQRALELLQTTVPIDSGDLYDSLQAVQVGDSVLSELSEISEGIVGSLEDIGL